MVAKQHRLGLTLLLPVVALSADPSGDWPNYGRTPGGDRHSPLAQINRENVAKLTLAWEYRTGEAGIETGNPTALETTPLVNDGVMYVSTPLGKVVALDPLSGKPRWSRDLAVKRKRYFGDWVTRGVSYWRDENSSRRMLAAHHRGDSRCTAGGAGRGERKIVRQLRQGRRGRPGRRLAQQAILRRRVRTDVTAGHRQRPHRGWFGNSRQQLDGWRERRSARLRRTQRRVALDLESGATGSPGSRVPDLEG